VYNWPRIRGIASKRPVNGFHGCDMWDAIESFPLSRFRALPTFEHP
jgi:hypothetical protein